MAEKKTTKKAPKPGRYYTENVDVVPPSRPLPTELPELEPEQEKVVEYLGPEEPVVERCLSCVHCGSPDLALRSGVCGLHSLKHLQVKATATDRRAGMALLQGCVALVRLDYRCDEYEKA